MSVIISESKQDAQVEVVVARPIGMIIIWKNDEISLLFVCVCSVVPLEAGINIINIVFWLIILKVLLVEAQVLVGGLELLQCPQRAVTSVFVKTIDDQVWRWPHLRHLTHDQVALQFSKEKFNSKFGSTLLLINWLLLYYGAAISHLVKLMHSQILSPNCASFLTEGSYYTFIYLYLLLPW